MNPYRVILILFFISSFCAIIGCSKYTDDELAKLNHNITIKEGEVQLIIEPEYDTYALGQDIWVKATIMNNSNKDFYITYDLQYPSLGFNITDPKGNIIRSGIVVDLMGPNDSIKVAPGNSYSDLINLNNWYMMDMGRANELIEGVYEIKAYYNKSVIEISKPIESNLLFVKIEYPEGDDLLFYNFYHNKENYENRPSIIELMKKYPDSRYVPQLYHETLIQQMNAQDSIGFFTDFHIFMNNSNTSFDTYYVIGYYAYYTNRFLHWDNKKVLNAIDSIQSIYTGTKKDKAIEIWKRNNDRYKALQ